MQMEPQGAKADWMLTGLLPMQVENVEVLEDNHLRFDFLGKDSIRYENEVAVHPKVHSLVRTFCAKDAANKSARLTSLAPCPVQGQHALAIQQMRAVLRYPDALGLLSGQWLGPTGYI